MNPTKLKLTNPTDDELSAAVAEHVAKLHLVESARMTAKPGEKCWCINEEYSVYKPVPTYATSADAVLPLLEKHDAIITHSVKERDWRVVIEGGRCNSAPTLPRAACIALLRANGIEVEQTAP